MEEKTGGIHETGSSDSVIQVADLSRHHVDHIFSDVGDMLGSRTTYTDRVCPDCREVFPFSVAGLQ